MSEERVVFDLETGDDGHSDEIQIGVLYGEVYLSATSADYGTRENGYDSAFVPITPAQARDIAAALIKAAEMVEEAEA